jgi:hypothetical protein
VVSQLWPLVGTDAVAAIGINRLNGNRRPAVSRGVAFLLERNGGISGGLMHHVPSAVATKTTVRSGWTIRLQPGALLLSVMQGRPVRLISARRVQFDPAAPRFDPRAERTVGALAAEHAISRTMSTMQQKAMIAGFTTAERDYIRRNLDQFFSTLPTVADGFLLKTWRSGPQAGQPKVPLPAKGLIERGLMRIDTTQHWPRLLFTETGLGALRAMMADRRLADPARYAHIRQELGIR